MVRWRWKSLVLPAFAIACLGGFASWLGSGCSGWDVTEPFDRNAPDVDEAIRRMDAGLYESAEQVLAAYLGTGACADGGIALPPAVREKSDGSFDLGLTLFYLAERYGARFGEEESGDGGPGDEAQMAQRSLEIDCALIIVKAIANDLKVPIELRARAHYLAGNLEFLRRKYEEAVKEYDEALRLVPGIAEEAGGDGIGRDAAWNRAIALRRIQDQKDAGADGGEDADDASDAPDAADGEDGSDASDGGDGDDGNSGEDASQGDSGDQPPDSGQSGRPDGGDGGPADSGNDSGGDSGRQDGQDEPDEEPDPEERKQPASPQPQPGDRILDQLEEAPSYQEEEAKKRAGALKRRGMEDK